MEPTTQSGKSSWRTTGGYRAPAEHALRAFGDGPVDISVFSGRLIALEGTDGVGRSTQVALLREWLETQGFGVVRTSLARGRLAGEGLRRAKLGTTLSQRTLDLFYATDFADRLENEILPSLRAGFVVLSDRYVYSMMSRSIVRGIERKWLEDLYCLAPIPHGVIYLKADIEHLVPRVLARGGFDYWESGMDFLNRPDLYSSFVPYQQQLMQVFDEFVEVYGFHTVDANRSVAEVFGDLRGHVTRIVSDMKGART